MKAPIRIKNRVLGLGHPLFVTAEVGVTSNYDIGMSKELIDVVSEAGADAAKFIFWFPDEIMSDLSVTFTYDTTKGKKTENMYEMLSKLTFSLDEWLELKAHADKRNVILFSTVNSPSGIGYAEQIGLHAYKLSSWDFNHHPLWRRIAKLGKPMLIDTGPVNLLDVAKVIRIMEEEGNEQCVLVHCYHTDDFTEVNMRAIPYMARAFNTLAGFSSRGRESELDILAIALGAVYLEKRLTLSRELPGHHQILSLEPQEFETYVKMVRDMHSALGTESLRPSTADLSERKKWFRHIVANREIPKGTVIAEEMLEGKRPEDGISPEYTHVFVGRVAKRDIGYNESLTWDDL